MIVRIVAVPVPFFVLSFLSSEETSKDSLQGLLEKKHSYSQHKISSLMLLNSIVMILSLSEAELIGL